MDFIALPSARHYTIRNVRLAKAGEDGTTRFFQSEVSVRDGRLTEQPSAARIDAGGGIVLPVFVDMHTHLDKGHTWPRASNPDGTFDGALSTVRNDRALHWSERDVRMRMDFSLQCAFAHGTRAIRTHLDSASPQHRISWPVFRETAQDWAGRMELQAVALVPIEDVDSHGDFVEIANLVAASEGVLGCVTYPCGDFTRRLNVLFRMAAEREVDLDLHVDETHDTDSNTLREIAATAIETGFGGAVTVGHCCSLARQPAGIAAETMELVARSGLAVVSLPMCNLYLQDRGLARTPRWRGVTLVHELDARGVPVCFASDNTRDPFYAYGDLDMVEVMREATRICHLDHASRPWLDAFSARPAEACGFSRSALEPGDPADFILFSARNWTELLARPQSDRVVVRNGLAIDRSLPDYRQLDELMETR